MLGAASPAVTVRTPSAASTLVLDWSACTAPAWVAVQDGVGAWTQVVPTGGIATFLMTAPTGGYAWADGNVNVRYATQAELTGAPISMCSSQPAAGTKFLTGFAVHSAVFETWSYSLGGGIGSSTMANPNFAITGIRNGVHDLIVFGSALNFGLRAIIVRDMNPVSGSSLGNIALGGADGTNAAFAGLTVPNNGAETISHTMNYLTTGACEETLLYSSTSFGLNGIPASLQRVDDFHELIVSSAGAGTVRTSSVVFHSLAARTVTLPTAVGAPAVTTVSGAAYKQLRASIGTIPSVYNGSSTLTYSQGARSMSVSASVAYTGSTGIVLTMPDFSAVSGWSASYALSSSASGNWAVVLDGSNGAAPRCTEGRTQVTSRRTGAY